MGEALANFRHWSKVGYAIGALLAGVLIAMSSTSPSSNAAETEKVQHTQDRYDDTRIRNLEIQSAIHTEKLTNIEESVRDTRETVKQILKIETERNR